MKNNNSGIDLTVNSRNLFKMKVNFMNKKYRVFKHESVHHDTWYGLQKYKKFLWWSWWGGEFGPFGIHAYFELDKALKVCKALNDGKSHTTTIIGG